MSAQTTRILVLGAVQIFGPANGYQLRRELLSWEVERWAYLNPGSIYSMLTTLEKQGAIRRYDVALDDARPVAVYTVTKAGDAEFERLVYEALATVPDSGDALPLRVAMNFGAALTRARFLDALAERVRILWAGVEEFDTKLAALVDPPVVPPHVVSELQLEVALMRAQLDWAIGLQSDVRAGGLVFCDDVSTHGMGWVPPADDPGWRMAEERSRYQEEIRKRHG
ncbi:MAG: PadR family transcriptional regulator [Pseudolysinimonas sp.]